MHVEDKDLVTTLSGQPDGPSLQAAVYARMDTPVGFTRWLTPLGNYLIARPAAKIAAHRDSDRTDVPLDGAVIFGLAPDALHVWGADPMLSTVKDHLGSVALTRITAMATETGKSWSPLRIDLDNGEQVVMEARGDVSGFVRTFEQLHGAPA